MSTEPSAAPPPSRVRWVAWTAASLVLLGLLHHGVLRPMGRALEGKRARIAANARLLAALPPAGGGASQQEAPKGKPLVRLSAGVVVQGLTELAHWTGIRRVTFTSREVSSLGAAPGTGKGRAVRLPVTVWLEAPAEAFAIYLDALAALPWPVRVQSFEMKRAPLAGDGVRIRVDLEVYGLAA